MVKQLQVDNLLQGWLLQEVQVGVEGLKRYASRGHVPSKHLDQNQAPEPKATAISSTAH